MISSFDYSGIKDFSNKPVVNADINVPLYSIHSLLPHVHECLWPFKVPHKGYQNTFRWKKIRKKILGCLSPGPTTSKDGNRVMVSIMAG